jgi:hypothetical protein
MHLVYFCDSPKNMDMVLLFGLKKSCYFFDANYKLESLTLHDVI